VADESRLRTVDEHLATVLDGIGSVEPIELTLLDAQGLLLAENVTTDVNLPGFDNSAMDGYAVRAVDTRDASPGPIPEREVAPAATSPTTGRTAGRSAVASRVSTARTA